jgi:hypothetical protein
MMYLVKFIDGANKMEVETKEEQVEAAGVEITPEGATFYNINFSAPAGREVIAHYEKTYLVRVIELNARS